MSIRSSYIFSILIIFNEDTLPFINQIIRAMHSRTKEQHYFRVYQPGSGTEYATLNKIILVTWNA